MPKVIVAWGEENDRVLTQLNNEEYKKWLIEHEGESAVDSYEFETQAEIDAFIEGIEQSYGWNNYNLIEI